MGLELMRRRQPRRLPLSTHRPRRVRACWQRRRALCMGSRSSSESPRSRCASLLVRHRVEDLCCACMLAAACKGPRQHACRRSAKLCSGVLAASWVSLLMVSWRGTGAPGAGDLCAGCGGRGCGAAAEREDPARDSQHHGLPDTLREGCVSSGMGRTRAACVGRAGLRITHACIPEQLAAFSGGSAHARIGLQDILHWPPSAHPRAYSQGLAIPWSACLQRHASPSLNVRRRWTCRTPMTMGSAPPEAACCNCCRSRARRMLSSSSRAGEPRRGLALAPLAGSRNVGLVLGTQPRVSQPCMVYMHRLPAPRASPRTAQRRPQSLAAPATPSAVRQAGCAWCAVMAGARPHVAATRQVWRRAAGPGALHAHQQRGAAAAGGGGVHPGRRRPRQGGRRPAQGRTPDLAWTPSVPGRVNMKESETSLVPSALHC